MNIRAQILLIYASAVLCTSAFGQARNEYEVKAVFLYNFTQFVQWPTSSFKDEMSPLVIGVLGENVFGGNLEIAVKGEQYNGRPIVVRYFTDMTGIDQCHILYISHDVGNPAAVTEFLKGKPVLTVSDHEKFMESSGMLRFYIENSKIRIEVNQEQAVRCQVTISSKLLNLATLYRKK